MVIKVECLSPAKWTELSPHILDKPPNMQIDLQVRSAGLLYRRWSFTPSNEMNDVAIKNEKSLEFTDL